MSWDGYLYRLKSQEEELFKVREELEREVREVSELFEKVGLGCEPLSCGAGETLQ